MAIRLVTSDPKPSVRNPGFWYFYYNKKTARGTDCAALLPESIRDLIHKGFAFDDNALRYSEELRCSLLELDFDEPQSSEEPSLPADPESGWADHDHLAADDSANPEALAAVRQQVEQATGLQIPNRGVRPATARKHEAEERRPRNIPQGLLEQVDALCAAQLYAQRRLGVTERIRPCDVQKLVVSAYINWSREAGADFTDAEERAMRF